MPLTSVGGQDMFTIKLLDIAQPPQRDDLSMRQGNGTVYVARSTGTAFVNEVWTRWSNVAWQDIRDGDFNGDGLADLSIRHPTGGVYVSLSTGTGFVSQKWADAENGSWTDILVGDFNADGNADLTMRDGTPAAMSMLHFRRRVPSPTKNGPAG